MGICELLTVCFIVLKLAGFIGWSWFFVLLPEIIAFVIYALFVISAVVAGGRAEKRFWKHINRDFDRD